MVFLACFQAWFSHLWFDGAMHEERLLREAAPFDPHAQQVLALQAKARFLIFLKIIVSDGIDFAFRGAALLFLIFWCADRRPAKYLSEKQRNILSAVPDWFAQYDWSAWDHQVALVIILALICCSQKLAVICFAAPFVVLAAAGYAITHFTNFILVILLAYCGWLAWNESKLADEAILK